MGNPAAKQGDMITASDMHQIQPPSSSPPTLVPHVFNGIIDNGLCSSVLIMGCPAATVNSTATNMPPHIPSGGSFVNPPSNMATISSGSATVMIGGQAAARNGDPANTCNDNGENDGGTIIASGTVMIG